MLNAATAAAFNSTVHGNQNHHSSQNSSLQLNNHLNELAAVTKSNSDLNGFKEKLGINY